MITFYQDRLGTNIRKAQKRNPFSYRTSSSGRAHTKIKCFMICLSDSFKNNTSSIDICDQIFCCVGAVVSACVLMGEQIRAGYAALPSEQLRSVDTKTVASF